MTKLPRVNKNIVEHLSIYNRLSNLHCSLLSASTSGKNTSITFWVQSGIFIIQKLGISCSTLQHVVYSVLDYTAYLRLFSMSSFESEVFSAGSCSVLISQNRLHLSLLYDVWGHMIINQISHLA